MRGGLVGSRDPEMFAKEFIEGALSGCRDEQVKERVRHQTLHYGRKTG